MKCADEFKPELWLKGIIESPRFDLIQHFFLKKETSSNKRVTILNKYNTENQFQLLKLYATDYSFEEALALIEEFINHENSYNTYYTLSEVLINTKHWIDKKWFDLINLFNNYLLDTASETQKYILFFEGYIKEVPKAIVLQNIHNLEREQCSLIFKSLPENKDFIIQILIGKISTDKLSDLMWLYHLANEFLDLSNFNLFDKKVFESIDQVEYFKLWKVGIAAIFPTQQLSLLLNDNKESYEQLNKWISLSDLRKTEICNFLFSYLNEMVSVTDRIIFYKQLYHIKYLLQFNETFLGKIKDLQNDFYTIILWHLDKIQEFDFELLKSKFIYFLPNEQVRIIRKLFYLKATDMLDLTVEKLNELIRFDLDLYKINLNFNPEIPVDISTDILIKALLSFKQNNRFFIESELITIVLEDLKANKTNRYKLSSYFEDCEGREIAVFNWRTQGEISKVKFGDNKFYFAITFEYDNDLVEAIRLLPGRKWNRLTGCWGVPSQFENEVLEFAKTHKFFLNFEGNKYTINSHLAEFKRDYKPNGIAFCEGRLSNKAHYMFNKEFWWCAGDTCFKKCETIHNVTEWEKYTLLDFCEILGFNTDEINKMGDFIPKGKYYLFIALINRFNQLLEKMYCTQCNHILFPSDFGTSHFAAHTVVRFQCRNDKCSCKDEIYLNHCLTGKCNNIVDSRVSKQCENGLFICEKCGSCCSHSMLKRRLENLKLNGGYIHGNLIKCVEEKLGHLERAQYFCYKCVEPMQETSHDVFECSKCNVKYDTTKYNFERPHRHYNNV